MKTPPSSASPKVSQALAPHQRPHIFVIQGDLTQLQVDAIVYPTTVAQNVQGHLSLAMKLPSLGFKEVYFDGPRPARKPIEEPGQSYWVSLEESGRPQGPYGTVITAVAGNERHSETSPAVIEEASRSALEVALQELVSVHERLMMRDAFARDVEHAIAPIARKWRLRDDNRQALLEASHTVADQLMDRGQRTLKERRRLRVAFPALGTGSGYSAKVSALELGRAQIRGILTALDALEPELRKRVDVILVAYNIQSHHNFLRVRHEALEAQWRFDESLGGFVCAGPRPWLQTPVDRRTVDPRTIALAEATRRGECVLFVGAGASAGVGMKSWQHLIEALLDDLQDLADKKRLKLPSLQNASTEDYLDIAQWHAVTRDQTGAPSHEGYVNRFFGPEATADVPLSLAHFLLLSLPFEHIITTNYDNLIERTLKALRRPHARIVRDQDVPRTGRNDEVSVVKFHGHAFSTSDDARPKRREAGGTIVLTREEYDTFFNRHPAKALLLEGLLLNHHFFFMGYSLSDPDFRQLQHRVIHMLEGAQRKAFATTLDDHRHWARAQWEDQELAQIPFHHGSLHDRIHAMWCWFDTLAELVIGSPNTFLTDTQSQDNPMWPIHQNLVTLGEQAEAAWEGLERLGVEELDVLEKLFDLLAGLGWRSEDSGRSWVQIWHAMSQHHECPPGHRVRYLRKALAAADRNDIIKELRAELEPLED